MAERRRIDVGGHRLAVATAGQGPPHFVCLHGLADTLEIWDAVAAPCAHSSRQSSVQSLMGWQALIASGRSPPG
jgi:hypothetical protein